MRTVRNWHDMVLFKFGLKKNITVVLRSGERFRIRNNSEYFRFIHGTKNWAVELARQMSPTIRISKNFVRVRVSGRDIILRYGSKTALGSSLGLAIEQLVNGQYSWLDVSGKDVVDVGASIGDTPMYFALHGARHVYALEPFPNSYRLAKRNIIINGLGSSITLLNKALGSKRASVSMRTGGIIMTGLPIKDGIAPKGKSVEILTLEDIVDRYDITGGVLKMDCEGYEYETILGAKAEVLRCFDQIMLEYHFGYLDLERKLKRAGFEVSHTIPKCSGYDNPYDPTMYLGLLRARRRSGTARTGPET
jgi:FkbM family methyltransferase